jgi:hypothetical protein
LGNSDAVGKQDQRVYSNRIADPQLGLPLVARAQSLQNDQATP